LTRQLRRVFGLLSLPLFLLSGCLFTTRRLPVPKAPTVTQTASPDELVQQLDDRWNKIESFYANVEIQASTLKTKDGVEKDYTTFPGIIMMRKPEWLRVYGRVPVIGSRMFDMVSDGKIFTLYIPSRDLVYKGANTLHKRSANTVENMRPGFFFDALIVRGLDKDDNYMVAADNETIEDAKKKHLIQIPEYILSVIRAQPGTREMKPIRVITIHRDDLLPYEQDLYDAEGNLETHVTYSNYRSFGGNLFPTTVIIKRPLEEFQIVLTVEKVVQNMKLTDDQFQIKIPEGTQIKNLE
jgi:outer membrane lipoprotein-sorting protein